MRLLRNVSYLCLASLAAAPSHATQLPAPAPYRVTDLQAHLFLNDRAGFSDNLAGGQEANLWNVIIRASDDGGPSNAVLMVVEVAGTAGSFASERSVELAARTSKKEIFRRRQSLAVLNAQGRTYVGFWLYETGCETLTVSTALLGQRSPTRRVVTIPFRCGE